MKVGTAAPRGSFGIPPEIHPDNIAKRQEQAPAAPTPQVDQGFAAPPSAAPDDDEMPISEKAKNVADLLKSSLGIELSGDDWSSLYYKGFIEKSFVVGRVPNPATKTFADFTITIHTLTAEEADESDELFAAEIRDIDVTREGIENRRNMWNLTYAIQKINGHEVCKPVRWENGNVDRRETAKLKRKVLQAMPTVILKQASLKYSQFVKFVDTLVSEPDQAFFA